MKSVIFAILLGLGAGLWGVAIRPFLPAWLGVDPLLPLSILFLVSSMRLSRPLACALVGAVLIDLFVVSSPDVALFRYAIILLLLDFLAHQFLTNRSLYATLGLVVLGRCLEWGSAWLFGSFLHWIGVSQESWMSRGSFWYTLGWDVVLVIVGFFFLVWVTRGFKIRYER